MDAAGQAPRGALERHQDGARLLRRRARQPDHGRRGLAVGAAAPDASWLWLLGYFVVITIGELYLSPIGLSLVSKVAPARMVSMLMGVWLATSFAGNFIAGWLGSFWSRMDKPMFFLMIAGIALVAGLVILAFERPLRNVIRDRIASRAMSSPSRPAPRAFGHVETWVFDLDNTLYPHHLNLWQQVDERIRDYIARFLKITHEEAFRLQKDYYKRYGTSMRGLMTEHGMKPDDFLDFVHQIDHSPLTPNAALGAAIENLPGRKLILTNGTRRHADAVLARLEIDHHFEDVFDIVAAELDPKPSPQTYDRFLKAHAVDAGKGRDVRGPRAQPGGAACARHDHGAGGAGAHARGVSRRLGARRTRRTPCRPRDRRSRRVSGANQGALTGIAACGRPCRRA